MIEEYSGLVEELHEFLIEVIYENEKEKDGVHCLGYARKLAGKFDKWHIRERKKWAMGLLQTIIEEGDCLPDGIALEVVTQICKKIEEG